MNEPAFKTLLRALGYTPATLAVDLDIPLHSAQRILGPKGRMRASEILELAWVLGMECDTLLGNIIPGEARAKRLKREGTAV